MSVLSVLRRRGFIEQTTHDDELDDYLKNQKTTCYIGFDPTASSLHVGSLVPIMSLVHMQRHGHRPIALVGGGTGMIGDPSGKMEMRRVLQVDTITKNAEALKRQLARFVDFDEGKALLINNAEWLTALEYIPFLREVGRHFSVNRMIKAESCRLRLESEEGLSFLEFNYMILQAYDFLELFNRHQCRIQMGGSDQWGNIVAGIDLIRRKVEGKAFGITFPLLTTAAGIKMGKTHKGAIWLDPAQTSPHEYFQYWRNADDRDVVRFLGLFTLLPMDEIQKIAELEGEALNSAKVVLAYEATAIAHGEKEAQKALAAAVAAFGGVAVPDSILSSSSIPRTLKDVATDTIPRTVLSRAQLGDGIPAFKLYVQTELAQSSGAARRLLNQGGGYLNDERISTFDQLISEADFKNGALMLRAGRKKYHKIVLE